MPDIEKVIILYRQVVDLEASLASLPDELIKEFQGQTAATYWKLRDNVLGVLCDHQELCDMVSIAPAQDEAAGQTKILGPSLFSGLAILKGALEAIVLSRGTRQEQRIVGFAPPPSESDESAPDE